MRRRPGELSDPELVAGARQGDDGCCLELVRRYERPVFGLIVRMVRDRPLAEDLAQEAFIKAFGALGQYDPRRKLSSWLFKIAHNATIDHLRRRRPTTVPLDGGGEEDQGGLAAVLPDEGTAAPDRLAESSDVGRHIEQAIAALRPEYREVVVLRHLEGLSYNEIAEITGQALGTVKTHLHRARKELADELAARGLEPSDE